MGRLGRLRIFSFGFFLKPDMRFSWDDRQKVAGSCRFNRAQEWRLMSRLLTLVNVAKDISISIEPIKVQASIDIFTSLLTVLILRMVPSDIAVNRSFVRPMPDG